VELHVWAAFAAGALIIAIVPGPGVASIVGFAFTSGRRTALASVAGMAVGNATALTVSLAGGAAVLASSALAFTLLKWIGAAYLIVIGLMAIAGSGTRAAVEARPRVVGARAAFLANVAVGTFHPKTILFFVAFASQFIDPGGSYAGQGTILVITFTAIAATTDTIYALCTARASGLLSSPRMKLWTRRTGGGVLVAAGLVTAAARR